MPENIPYVNSSCPGQKVSIPFQFIRDLSHIYHSVAFSLDAPSREAYDILCSRYGEGVLVDTVILISTSRPPGRKIEGEFTKWPAYSKVTTAPSKSGVRA
jgi:hypothetical protein